jgi:hypothetical protein
MVRVERGGLAMDDGRRTTVGFGGSSVVYSFWRDGGTLEELLGTSAETHDLLL